MPGQTSLTTLIASMSPTPDPTNKTYVFVTVPAIPIPLPPDLKMLFYEPEGWTLILPQSVAEAQGYEWTFPCKMITLNVHSSLEAVGFLARVTTRLAERVGTGVNPGLEGRCVEELRGMAREEGEKQE
ncbi:hypothetical protein PRZ48_000866 [Zasmidium cellare]|uniref:DUF2241 domain-containing protein n=1 Tax=Zasmidium cellare TaxID=395010 RepID=A0ABR0EZP8_ZASCE|nr:hypothetical protein PRZ48_000866 [Zasmidium cellare]